MNKYRFNNYTTQDGEINVLLYGEIDQWGINAKDVVTTLSMLEKEYPKINLRINSCGGSVFEGIAIYNAIRSSNADITIYVDGLAASMASVIALCGRKVYMSKYSQLMIHCVSGGAWGNTKEIEQTLEEMKALESTICKMYSDKTGMSEEDIKAKYMDGQDHWLSAQESLELGFVDGIYEDEDGDAPKDRDELYKRIQAKLQIIHNNKHMKEKLMTLPQFSDCADDGAVMERINGFISKAARVDELENELASMKAAAKEKEISDILAKAKEEHRITEQMAESFKTAYADNAEGLKALIESFPAKEKVVTNPSNEGDAILKMSWDELHKSNQLAILKNKYPEAYERKFNEKFHPERV